jgi:hypothetical protein
MVEGETKEYVIKDETTEEIVAMHYLQTTLSTERV